MSRKESSSLAEVIEKLTKELSINYIEEDKKKELLENFINDFIYYNATILKFECKNNNENVFIENVKGKHIKIEDIKFLTEEEKDIFFDRK